MSSEFRFQVNLRGIIDLLSGHLYSDPRVFVRELLQNAADAIVARRRSDPRHEGRITFEVFSGGTADSRPTLAVRDNGIGLSMDECHRFLATIGETSKQGLSSGHDFIGRFGIGLLSGFLVGERITMITRSTADGTAPVEWVGRSDGTYTIREVSRDVAFGTEVFLTSKPGCEDFFGVRALRDAVGDYGRYLPVAIEVRHGEDAWRIDEDPPWVVEHLNVETEREALLAYGRDVLQQDFFDALLLESEAGGVRGVAFVLPSATHFGRQRGDRVYLRGMLLCETAKHLLPDWAFFVVCIVNATRLNPTASREALREDELLADTRHELGDCLRRYLTRLAQDDRQRLLELISLHRLAIKALAMEDDELYRLFIDWLPFETTLGEMLLGDYIQQQPIVRYVPSVDEFRQIAGIAAAQRLPVINGGYVYDAALLERMPQLLEGRQVETLGAADLFNAFEDLSIDQRDRLFDVVRLANVVLQPFHCTAEVRKFEPAEVPAFYAANDAAGFQRSVVRTKDCADSAWGDVLNGVAEERTAQARACLCLNYNNPLIRKLESLDGRDWSVRVLETLYLQALLMAHRPLQQAEMGLLTRRLLEFVELGMNENR